MIVVLVAECFVFRIVVIAVFFPDRLWPCLTWGGNIYALWSFNL
jgi:hypothetical protein